MPTSPSTLRGKFSQTIAVLPVVVLALALRMWRIEQNAWGNEYYTAAVRSMAASWHNFFYAAFDPGGFISVDKPPIALWIQVASVWLFGFRPVSVLLPQVIEGVVAVLLLYHLVQRRFGFAAGWLAALFLALTPVSVAVDRSNITDSCLALVLVLAAWALVKAAETGDRRALLLSACFVGIAFNVKMLAGFIVLPALCCVYFVAAPMSWQRRLLDLSLAGTCVLALSLAWMLAVELTPVDERPFVGSSTRNSVVELVAGYNGIGRFASRDRRAAATPGSENSAQSAAAQTRTRTDFARLFVRAPVGPLRLGDGQLAAQALWFFPLALIAPIAALLRKAWRRPFAPADITLLLWFLWMLTYAIVYSFAGGIFHFYYLSAMAPALAALAAIGLTLSWSWYRTGGARAAVLPVVLIATAAWEMHVQTSALGWSVGALVGNPSLGWHEALHWSVILGTTFAVMTLCAGLANKSGWFKGVLAPGAATIAVGSLLLLPFAWALSCVVLPANGVVPSADLARFDGSTRDNAAGRERFMATLIDFLHANRRDERFLLTTSTYQLAAPIIIRTGEPVLARGGFHGLDPAVTPERLADLVQTRQVRFAALGDVSNISRRMGADQAGGTVASWIRTHGTLVDPALWRRGGASGIELYDLRAEASSISAPSTR